MLKASSGVALSRFVHKTEHIAACLLPVRSQIRSLVSCSQSPAHTAATPSSHRARPPYDQKRDEPWLPTICSEVSHDGHESNQTDERVARPPSSTNRIRGAELLGKRHRSRSARRTRLEDRSNLIARLNGQLVQPTREETASEVLSSGGEELSYTSSLPNGAEESLEPAMTQAVSSTIVEELSVDELRAVIMSEQSDVNFAWAAYRRLSSFELKDTIGLDNYTELDVRLLSKLVNRIVEERKRTKRNTQELYLRILAVLNRLRQERGRDGFPHLRTLEWNVLIYYSITGQRGKIPLSSFTKALHIYMDMIGDYEEAKGAGLFRLAKRMEPDIITYNTLIHLAVRTEHQPAVDRVQEMMRSSNLEPDRFTRLSMIQNIYRNEGLQGVITLLRSMKPDEIGSDGICAFLTCAGRDGRMSVVNGVYETLRKNLEGVRDGKIDGDSDETIQIEGFTIPRTLIPSEEIYSFTIQTYAYHDRPKEALKVFTDMLSTRRSYPNGEFFQPSSQVFRGLFLGFARHGQLEDDSLDRFRSDWTWEKLRVLLRALYTLQHQIRLSERTIWWIITGVRKTTRGDTTLRYVLRKLNTTFGTKKRGRLKRLEEKFGTQSNE